MANPLDYNNGEHIVPDGAFRISPSGIARFFTAPTAWWRENLLGEAGFEGSTASVLGTCVHYCAERYALTGTLSDEDKQHIEDYIDQESAKNSEVDPDIIRTQFKIMATNLINEYLIYNHPQEVEPFVVETILPNIMVGGSIDNITNNIIVDYKTSSLTKLPDTIKFEYRLQLLTYAWIKRKQGTPIDRIRIVYVSRDKPGKISDKTGKQLKSYPSQVKVLTENVTQEDFDYIEGIINLIAHSVQLWNEQPELRYALAKDWRLHPSQLEQNMPTNKLFIKDNNGN